MNKMEVLLKTLLVFVIGLVTETWGRRISAGGMIDERTDGQLNVRLEMPPFVRAGDTAVLRCKYDLGTDPLYQVKWYKGSKEFYRYTPKESPSTKSFPLVGIQIDLSRSDATQLTLKKVDLNMTAKYSCEVSVDFPDYTTEIRTAVLYVVAFPEHKPEISLSKRPLAVGDVLDANCTSHRSKPAANLTWLVNGELASPSYMTSPQLVHRDWDSRETSILGLRFVVTPAHFIQGKLTLGCIAKIHNIFHKSAETTINEYDRPKISSVVDNSSSAASSSGNLFKSSGAPYNIVNLITPKGVKVIMALLAYTVISQLSMVGVV